MPIQAQLFQDEAAREALFPVVRNGVFLAHAGVCPLPRPAAEAVQKAAAVAMGDSQETPAVQKEIAETRIAAAKLIHAKPHEIALIGPTALGLSLVANGLPWAPGDEVVHYGGDYPSNVYPWTDLARHGVKPVTLVPDKPGHITPELVFAALTPKTKLVALASCHFLTGYRVDLKAIGAELKRRGVLFCVDGIQSVGATPVDADDFDFLSADSHKWLLGPMGAGIFYVKERHFPLLRPTLLGSLNVHSPNFIAQPGIAFPDTGRRYECGALFTLGLLGMKASMEMLLALGIDRIEARLLQIHAHAAGLFRAAGFEVVSDAFPEGAKSGIVTIRKPGASQEEMNRYNEKLLARKVTASLRWDGAGTPYLRFSPHFYNTEAELGIAAAALAD